VDPTTLFQDNQGAIKIGRNFMSNKRSKHIDIKIHFIQNYIQDKQIKLEYMPTSEMIADCLTKPVGKIILERGKSILFGLTK
jgi:hypothetical protein